MGEIEICDHTPEQFGASQVVWHDRIQGLGTVTVRCTECGEMTSWSVSA